MNEQFVTLYIEKMSKKLEELSKKEILLETQLELMQNLNASLLEEINKLKEPQEPIDIPSFI